MNAADGLRRHAERIQEGLEEAREKNALQGWYNFVSRHDVELLVKYAMQVSDGSDSP